MEGLLRESADLLGGVASQTERMDLRLARGFLKIQIWEYGSKHFHRGNPSLYTGESVFGVMSLFLNHGGALSERIQSAIHRMEAIPELLAQARHNLSSAPGLWIERAIRECDGALAFLTSGVSALVEEEGISDPGFQKAARFAAEGVDTFRRFLDADLESGSGAVSCGEEALAMYLGEGHFLTETADEILAYAESELAEASAFLDEHAMDFGARDRGEALTQLSSIAPTAEDYLDHYQELWDQVKGIAEEQSLLSWPDFPIRYRSRPLWAREAAPYLYFLFYRSPAAYDRPPVHDYLVTPIEASMSQEVQRRLLAANNTSVAKLNHIVHHGSIGHHVQNWHAFRAESRIGQMAAVDCASRIAMFCGGTMAEGWACYATDLMSGTGFLTPLEQYAEKASRIRMCARAIVDIRLHQGRIDLGQATAFYEEVAEMPAAAAQGEAVKNSMFPGAAVIYLMGTDGIHRLRKEVQSLRGSDFVLKDFHDEFLSYGSVPVSLVAKAMKAKQHRANS